MTPEYWALLCEWHRIYAHKRLLELTPAQRARRKEIRELTLPPLTPIARAVRSLGER